ncbi:MAG: hypothetical protein AVDCRST_MAG18-2797 [uncultured Thermomicrobiales bacterium]|uniref:ATP synthase protein I n=1 Tax=uncultured Thermomicrobiales bacterium TaxID=1645740 RepID=A0A6J4VIE3_9BACT|nr:MAG: hypothetical protein AVDCRST_MAG18-2797 [uncultured Thermomicrobiales bacterium]
MGGEKPGRERAKTPLTPSEIEEDRLKQTRLRLVGLSLEFGFTIVGAFVIFMGGGIWLDRRFGTSPLFLLIGMALAFIAIGYTLYEIATIGYKPRAAKVATGTKAPVAPPAPTRGWDDEPAPQDDWDRDDWGRDDDWPVRKAGEKGGGG